VFSPAALIVAAVTVFLAGAVQGLMGLGFSLVTVPILVVFLAPRIAVPVVLILSTVINVLLYREVRGQADLKRMLPLVIAGVASLPVGTYLLVSLDAGMLKIIIGALISCFALALLAGWQRPVRREVTGLVAAGLASGILNGVTSTSGPPVIFFLANQGMPREAFRASLITYFMFLNLATVPVYLAGGLLTREVLAESVILLPGMVAGGLAGSRLTSRVPEAAFRKAALSIVFVAGLFSVLAGAGVL